MHNHNAPAGGDGVIRYAQCWEDADVLLKALDVQPQHVCLSIASAGDNTLALLSRAPQRVIAVDSSPAQIACLELRVGAYQELRHGELLELIGSLPSHRRGALYRRCRLLLSSASRDFWDAHEALIHAGIGGAGKFEHYLNLFRRRILPLIHPRERVQRLLRGGTAEERERFYGDDWNTWRWRWLCRLFFSRFVMARLGRDPACFRYCPGALAPHLLARACDASTRLNPADNPYLQWISSGRHLTALPYALRLENFEAIRHHLDRVEIYCVSLEEFLKRADSKEFDRFNLSDIFEYVGPEDYHCLLQRLLQRGKQDARLAYWNMRVERSRPAFLQDRLRPMTELARQLYREDKVFFYSAFVVEEAR